MANNQSEREHLASLRTEYQACTHRIAASGGWAWQSTSIVVGAGLAAAAIVLTGIDKISIVMVVLLGVCMVFILLALPFYFRRERWRQQVLFNRMAEIERDLGLEIGLDIDRLDTIQGAKQEEEASERLRKKGVDEEHIKRYWELHQRLPAPCTFGWDSLYVLVSFAVLAWLFIICLEAWKGSGGWTLFGIGLFFLSIVDLLTWYRLDKPKKVIKGIVTRLLSRVSRRKYV